MYESCSVQHILSEMPLCVLGSSFALRAFRIKYYTFYCGLKALKIKALKNKGKKNLKKV